VGSTIRSIATSGVLVSGLVLASPGIAAAEPLATASATTGLSDGQTVSVDYSGFPAGATIAVVQCTSEAPASNTECDEERLALGSSDPNGAGTAEFTVHTGAIGTAGGTCDAGSSCAIVVTDFPVTTSVAIPITFAAEAAEETTTSTIDAGEPTSTDVETGDDAAATAESDEPDDDDDSSPTVPIVLGGAAIAAVVAAVLFARRRRS